MFDSIAEDYDARRSGYPGEIVDAAVEIAGLVAGSPVVEVGAGTGKLTEELVGHGLRVDAVEPGENMIELARRRLGDTELVRFHVGRFEEVDLALEGYDAVFAASSFHWVDPNVGWAKAAAVLRPGGTIAIVQPVSVREACIDPSWTSSTRRLCGWRLRSQPSGLSSATRRRSCRSRGAA